MQGAVFQGPVDAVPVGTATDNETYSSVLDTQGLQISELAIVLVAALTGGTPNSVALGPIETSDEIDDDGNLVCPDIETFSNIEASFDHGSPGGVKYGVIRTAFGKRYYRAKITTVGNASYTSYWIPGPGRSWPAIPTDPAFIFPGDGETVEQDRVAPTVVSSTPAADAENVTTTGGKITPQVVCSKAINPTTVNTGTCHLVDDDDVENGRSLDPGDPAVGLGDDLLTITVGTFSVSMVGQRLRIKLSGVADPWGNRLPDTYIPFTMLND